MIVKNIVVLIYLKTDIRKVKRHKVKQDHQLVVYDALVFVVVQKLVIKLDDPAQAGFDDHHST